MSWSYHLDFLTMHMDNMIKYIVVFANKFLYDRKVVLIMHINDM